MTLSDNNFMITEPILLLQSEKKRIGNNFAINFFNYFFLSFLFSVFLYGFVVPIETSQPFLSIRIDSRNSTVCHRCYNWIIEKDFSRTVCRMDQRIFYFNLYFFLLPCRASILNHFNSLWN